VLSVDSVDHQARHLVKSSALNREHCSGDWQDRGVNASATARDLARATLIDSIKQAARRQVAAEGAARLSVRAVAREVGMVSSAVYRYFPSRDELLTALIIDAYDALGLAVEKAVASVPPERARARWRAACAAVRNWATAGPQQYGLLFGSPVPGYRAPQDTVAPGARVPVALMAVVRDGWVAGRLTGSAPVASTSEQLSPRLSGQLAAIGDASAGELPPAVVLSVAVAWTQLFGMVTFELFGQLAGSLDPADDFFDAAVDAMADLIGLARD
jgi:AcrR family transcriptional regulator